MGAPLFHLLVHQRLGITNSRRWARSRSPDPGRRLLPGEPVSDSDDDGLNGTTDACLRRFSRPESGVMRINAAAVFTGYLKARLPINVGGFGHAHSDVGTIMATAQARRIGYLGRSWSGNSSDMGSLDMTDGSTPTASPTGISESSTVPTAPTASDPPRPTRPSTVETHRPHRRRPAMGSPPTDATTAIRKGLADRHRSASPVPVHATRYRGRSSTTVESDPANGPATGGSCLASPGAACAVAVPASIA